jgi:hypothetical protein
MKIKNNNTITSKIVNNKSSRQHHNLTATHNFGEKKNQETTPNQAQYNTRTTINQKPRPKSTKPPRAIKKKKKNTTA